EARAETAADHDRFHVEQVDRRRDRGAERFDGALHQLARELVVALERTEPHAAREARDTFLFHDLEQLRLASARDLLARRRLHRAAPGVGFEAAESPAGAARAARLDDHVPDLARRAATSPTLAVDHEAAADSRAPPQAEERPRVPARALQGLAVERHADVVA